MLTGLLCGSLAVYRAQAEGRDRVVDDRVQRVAEEILKAVQEELAAATLGDPSLQAQARISTAEVGHHRYQVWLHQGKTLLRSRSTSAAQPLLPIDFSGYKEVALEGTSYRAYSAATSDRDIVVQVAEPTPERSIKIDLIPSEYFTFTLASLGVMFGITGVLVKQAFKPLDAMAENLLHRGPRDVDKVVVKDPPQEILPIVRSLDSLFGRIGYAMSVEHRFTSVAAHELKTPLAGIRAQAQLAAKASDAQELQDSLKSVILGVDRASRVIDQLIDLNRVESAQDTIEWSALHVDLQNVYDQVIDELGPKAARKSLTLNVSFNAEHLRGLDFAIYMLLRNLIANAILYSPMGGRVDVSSHQLGDEIVLTVGDSGPGIPAQARDRAFEKFNRLGRNGSDGVGLGLSIVAQVVHLHQAKIALSDSPLGGLQAQVVFPKLG